MAKIPGRRAIALKRKIWVWSYSTKLLKVTGDDHSSKTTGVILPYLRGAGLSCYSTLGTYVSDGLLVAFSHLLHYLWDDLSHWRIRLILHITHYTYQNLHTLSGSLQFRKLMRKLMNEHPPSPLQRQKLGPSKIPRKIYVGIVDPKMSVVKSINQIMPDILSFFVISPALSILFFKLSSRCTSCMGGT